MNIFILDKDPRKAARMLCDKHVGKMAIESAQMLCTAHWETENCCAGVCNPQYKKTHFNHPCTLWARESVGNYKWLVEHALELCKEFKKRYGKNHKSCEVVKWASKNIPRLSKKRRTPFAQAMPEKYRDKDAVKAYRKFYIKEKLNFARWKCGNKPRWIKRE